MLLLSVIYNAKVIFTCPAFNFNRLQLEATSLSVSSGFHLLVFIPLSASFTDPLCSQFISKELSDPAESPLSSALSSPSKVLSPSSLTLCSEEQTWLLPNWGCQFPLPILPPLWRLPLYVLHNNPGAPVMCQRALQVLSYRPPAQA